MALTKENIKRIVREYISANIEIKFAYIFGSFVDEENYNDIDLALYPSKEIDTIEIAHELERLTSTSFDVIDLKNTPDHLIHSISKGEIIADNDENFRIDFISAAWNKYMDFKYYRDRYLEELNYNE